jgi:hypothetical protein
MKVLRCWNGGARIVLRVRREFASQCRGCPQCRLKEPPRNRVERYGSLPALEIANLMFSDGYQESVGWGGVGKLTWRKAIG